MDLENSVTSTQTMAVPFTRMYASSPFGPNVWTRKLAYGSAFRAIAQACAQET